MESWLRRAVLAAAILFPAFSGAAAQERQAKEPDGIEGVWDARITIFQCDNPNQVLLTGRGIVMFGPGGRMTSVTDNFLHSATLGTWRHLRGKSYTATDIFFVFNADGSLAGSQEVTREIELSTNANEYTTTATFQILNTSDQVISTGCATATATRLE